MIKDLFGILDHPNCTCKKKLFDKLVEECMENIDETKINNENENENKYCFSIMYIACIVLFSIIFVISIVVGIYFVYQKYANCNKYDLPYLLIYLTSLLPYLTYKWEKPKN